MLHALYNNSLITFLCNYVFLCLPQWTFGLQAALWQRCCKENLCLKAVTVSFYLFDLFLWHSQMVQWVRRDFFSCGSAVLFSYQSIWKCESHLNLDPCSSDLDQLTEIMKVTGTPTQDFISKLESEDVSVQQGIQDLKDALPGFHVAYIPVVPAGL